MYFTPDEEWKNKMRLEQEIVSGAWAGLNKDGSLIITTPVIAIKENGETYIFLQRLRPDKGHLNTDTLLYRRYSDGIIRGENVGSKSLYNKGSPAKGPHLDCYTGHHIPTERSEKYGGDTNGI